MTLIRAEVERMLSRRFFRILLVTCAVGVIAAGIANFVTSTKSTTGAVAEARTTVAECERSRASAGARPGGLEFEFDCPTVEEVLPAYDKRYRYAEEVIATSRGLAIFGAVLAFVVGASVMGAEWGTGAIATLLTWEPRRARVLFAKAAAAFVVVAVAVVLLLAWFALLHIPSGAFRGTMSGVGAAFWRELTGIWGRGAALAGIGALFGVGAASLTRNTAGAVGAGGIFMAVIDPLASNWEDRLLGSWLFQQNIAQFIGFPVPSGRPTFENNFEVAVRVLSPWRPALLLSLYVIGLLAVAYAVFRARDVT